MSLTTTTESFEILHEQLNLTSWDLRRKLVVLSVLGSNDLLKDIQNERNKMEIAENGESQ